MDYEPVADDTQRVVAMAMTQHVANRALAQIESHHSLRPGDTQVLFGIIASAPAGATAAVAHFYPLRLEILAAYVSNVSNTLLECSKLGSASPELLTSLHSDLTSEELVGATDYVIATSLLVLEAMLAKPMYRLYALSEAPKIAEAVRALIPSRCGPMTNTVLPKVAKALNSPH
jgi:hypothetical protein